MRRLARRAAIVSAARTPTPGTSTGTMQQTIPAVTQTAAGWTTVPGTIVQTLQAFTQESSGTVSNPSVTGTIVQTLPALTQQASNVTSLAGLSDVDTTGVADGDVLTFHDATSEWKPA